MACNINMNSIVRINIVEHGKLRLYILVDVSFHVHVLVVVHTFITDGEN